MTGHVKEEYLIPLAKSLNLILGEVKNSQVSLGLVNFLNQSDLSEKVT